MLPKCEVALCVAFLSVFQTRLVYNANKPSLQCKEALFENETIVHFVSVW